MSRFNAYQPSGQNHSDVMSAADKTVAGEPLADELFEDEPLKDRSFQEQLDHKRFSRFSVGDSAGGKFNRFKSLNQSFLEVGSLKKFKRRVFFDLISLVAVAAVAVMLTPLLPSGSVAADRLGYALPFDAGVKNAVAAMRGEALKDIHEIVQDISLPWNELPCPAPDPGCFDGHNYKDESIEVVYYTDRIFDSNVHFVEVKIASPTQIRTAWAGGEAGSKARESALTMAKRVNAVVAMNADYAGYKPYGICIRQGHTLFVKPQNRFDILMIDKNGDFKMMFDADLAADTKLLESGDIINSFSFGPTLVVDGEIQYTLWHTPIVPAYNTKESDPRVAIGQIGPLHYLLCLVEGRKTNSPGVNISKLAKIMHDKGCQQAYNFDGGHSLSLIIGGEVVASPHGGLRTMSDIIFFATAKQ
ncbi:MAG: phosphodiester glycosidase family protein [Oscillospiraceae bacterium]|nr:phosphodiester glycosidase family protein [Oscillospiraceae bacterium]